MVHLADYIVIAVYFLVIMSIGLAVSRRQKKTTEDYFVASRRIPAWAVAFTLMATLIGSSTVVGHPATVFQNGMVLLLGHLSLLVVLLIVAKWIVPFYRNTVKMSAYEYIGRRFGFGGRIYSSLGFLADRVLDLGQTLLFTAIPIKVMTGWDLSTTILVAGFVTVLYTAIGGVEAVVWTDVVQGVMLLAAPLLILWRLLFAPEAGPPGAVVGDAWRAGKFHLGSFDLSLSNLTSAVVTSQWLYLVQYTINWGRRYIADQHMVQRYLLARTDREASRGAFWNALMCVPIWVGFMFVGACLAGYYSLTDPEQYKKLLENPTDIVPLFMIHKMPVGLIGAIVAAILAASMSSIAGDLNAVSTVVTTDYFANLFPRSSDRTRLMFGRVMVVIAGMIAAFTGLILVPEKSDAKSVMERTVTIAAILSGGTLGLFCLGFLTTRATRQGCYVGIIACLIFTAWGVLTSGSKPIVSMGRYGFHLNPILIGICGHFVLFGVGYLTSIVIGGYRPGDVEQLTFRWRQANFSSPGTPGEVG
jgi:SSS family solute:Na+ symporter